MLIAARKPVWNPTGRPTEMINDAVSRRLRWRVDHPNLYEYLIRHSLSDDDNGAVAANVSGQLGDYFRVVGLDELPVEPLGFGIVGFVESAVTHWLNNPAPQPQAEFTAQLAEWIWALLSSTLQSRGIRLEPQEPIPAPAQEV